MRKALLAAVLLAAISTFWGANYGQAPQVQKRAQKVTAEKSLKEDGADKGEGSPARWLGLGIPTSRCSRRPLGSQQKNLRTGESTRVRASSDHTTGSLRAIAVSAADDGKTAVLIRRLSSRSGFGFRHLGTFVITAYTNGPEDTGKAPGTPGYGVTATGTTATTGHTIAADWSVLPPGTLLLIDGLNGVYRVEDSGGAIHGQHIDLFVNDRDAAIQWGVQHRKVTVLIWGRSGGAKSAG